MNFYIPTLGRFEKQITYNNLPKIIQKKTRFVIQPKEQDLFEEKYKKEKIIVLPKNDIGIAKTRQFITDLICDNKEVGFMFDDDLTFTYRKDHKHVSIIMDDKKFLEVFNLIDLIFRDNKEVAHVGLERAGVFPRKGLYAIAKVFFTVHIINGKRWDKNIRWDEAIDTLEDIDICFQEILCGKNPVRINPYNYKQKGRNTDGGCSTYRTEQFQIKKEKELLDKYKDFITKKIDEAGNERICKIMSLKAKKFYDTNQKFK